MPQRSPEYQPGQAIPGTVYRVHRVLGAGGMGTVYDVEDTTVGKRYVLKTLHGDLADRSDLAARLAREARALAKLQHPNIVEVYTSGTTQDSLRLPYYVMERLQGQSLRTVLERKGRLTVEQACDIGIDLLDALDHAHEFGIIHRDVKPDNIFITRGRDGRSLAKLLDFGIIKLATGPGAAATLATGGRFIGTFRYAPPEQILGRDVTPRSDLYAAGLVLYEMIAGRGPFDDFTGEMEIGKAHIDVAPPPLSRFAIATAAIEQLVMSALQKDPNLRPRDAFTFASALREVKKQLASVSITGKRSQAATVEQVVEHPVSAARPAQPFGAMPTNADVIVPSAGQTRIDSPSGKLANTATALSGRSTVSLGVAPHGAPLGAPLQETIAAAPLTMATGGGPALAATPGPIDRRAETREAAPQPIQRPRNDTAPIPLAVFTPRSESVPPQPSIETFGPHTTEASQRKKAARSAVVAVILSIAAVACIAIGGLVVWKRHAQAVQAERAAATATTAAAAVAPTLPPATTATETAATETPKTASPQPSAAPPEAATHRHGKRPHSTHAADTHGSEPAPTAAPTHTAAPVHVSPPPTATPSPHPVHRLPGSGL
jgi:serine/threonine protein kinase